MDDIQITSTSQARTSASTLAEDAAYYTTLVEELRTASTQIQANWEGDAADINDIVSRIEIVCGEFEAKIVPTLKDLSSAITTLADDIDVAASSTVEGGSNDVSGNDGTSTGATDGAAGQAAEGGKEKKSFWKYHGDNFANDWDYSGCDSGLDYIGATVDGVVGTVGSVVNFVVDGASEILGWLFG